MQATTSYRNVLDYMNGVGHYPRWEKRKNEGQTKLVTKLLEKGQGAKIFEEYLGVLNKFVPTHGLLLELNPRMHEDKEYTQIIVPSILYQALKRKIKSDKEESEEPEYLSPLGSPGNKRKRVVAPHSKTRGNTRVIGELFKDQDESGENPPPLKIMRRDIAIKKQKGEKEEGSTIQEMDVASISLNEEDELKKMWECEFALIQACLSSEEQELYVTLPKACPSLESLKKREGEEPLSCSIKSYSLQGIRHAQEDRWFVEQRENDVLAGCLDGHGGTNTASFVKKHFPILFFSYLEKTKRAVRTTFELTVTTIQSSLKGKKWRNGCTGAIVFVNLKMRVIWSCTLSDSQSYICRQEEGISKLIQLSPLIDWRNLEDARRLVQVINETPSLERRKFYIKLASLILDSERAKHPEEEQLLDEEKLQKLSRKAATNIRAPLRGLNVPNAFGDYKIPEDPKDFIADPTLSEDFITDPILCQPEYTMNTIEEGDIAFIYTDGIENLSKANMIGIVSAPWEAERNVAQQLTRAAIKRGSSDNATAIAIKFS